MNEKPFFPLGTLYADERCERVRAALEQSSTSITFSVWKAHRRDASPDPSDRYLMFTEDVSVIGVEEWELDILSDDELVAYLMAQSKKGGFSTLEWVLLALGGILLASSLLFIPFWDIWMPITSISWVLVITLFILAVVMFYAFQRMALARTRKMDYTLSEEYPPLLDALRKLASDPNIPLDASKRYAQRLQHLEHAMSRY